MQSCTAAIVAAAAAATSTAGGPLTCCISRILAVAPQVQGPQHIRQSQKGGVKHQLGGWQGAERHHSNIPSFYTSSIPALGASTCARHHVGWAQHSAPMLGHPAASRGFASTSAGASAGGDSSTTAAEPARRRRRGATESQAVLRRTTVSTPY